jgi:hypothetical protein
VFADMIVLLKTDQNLYYFTSNVSLFWIGSCVVAMAIERKQASIPELEQGR